MMKTLLPCALALTLAVAGCTKKDDLEKVPVGRISRGDTWAWVVPATPEALFRLAAAPPTPDFDEEASVGVLSRLLNDIHAKKEGKVHTDQLLEDIKKEDKP